LCDFLYTAQLIPANPMPFVGRPKAAKTLPRSAGILHQMHQVCGFPTNRLTHHQLSPIRQCELCASCLQVVQGLDHVVHKNRHDDSD